MHVLLWKITISYTPREPEKITDDNSVTAAPRDWMANCFLSINVSNCSIIILLNNQMEKDGKLNKTSEIQTWTVNPNHSISC